MKLDQQLGPGRSPRLTTPSLAGFFFHLNFFGSVQGVTELLDEFPGPGLARMKFDSKL